MKMLHMPWLRALMLAELVLHSFCFVRLGWRLFVLFTVLRKQH